MTVRFEDLEAAIERNDPQAVVRLLCGASEAERRAVGPRVRALAKKTFAFRGERAAAAVATLGTANGVRQAVEVFRYAAIGDAWAEAVSVLSDRAPSWLPQLPSALLTGQDIHNLWQLTRGLVRASLVPKPDVPEYTTKMPYGLMPSMFHAEPVGKSIEEQLRDDPDLLRDEVFRLFRVEGTGRLLHTADGWVGRSRGVVKAGATRGGFGPEATWRATLARLARKGLIDFDRLLNECLAAFLRDFRPVDLTWYVAMHEELAPTTSEIAVRTDQYLRLLAADVSVAIGLAQRALESLLRENQLNLEAFIAASEPPLHRPEKTIALKQMRLLSEAAKRRPDLGSELGTVVRAALAHERPEIKEAAAALLVRLQSAEETAKGASPTPAVALGAAEKDDDAKLKDREASLRSRAAPLISQSPWAQQMRSALGAIEAGKTPETVVIPIGPGSSLPRPISQPDELIELLTRLVEDARDPVSLERALGGAVRTARIPLAQRQRMAQPLAKRAREQLGGYPSGLTGGDVRAMIASVAFTWATGRKVAPGFGNEFRDFALQRTSVDERFAPVTPTGVFAVRALEVIELVAKSASAELLSEPTHERGVVDPEEFLERANRNYGGLLGGSPPRYDLELAALRLPTETALQRINQLPGRVRKTFQQPFSTLPAEISLSIVSGVPAAKQWEKPDRVVLAKTEPIGKEASILRSLTQLADPLETYIRLSGESEFSAGYGAAVATWPMIAPWYPELIAAHLLRPLSRGLRPGKHDLAASALGALMHADTALGPIGHLAVALGIIGAEGDTRTAAADLVSAASRDGRLDPRLLADGWVELARAGVFQAKRVEATLQPLISEPASGVRLAQALALALGPLVEAGARDLHVLLRVQASLATSYGIVSDDPRVAKLADKKEGNQIVAAARALKDAQANSPGFSKAASLDLLEGLLDRADRGEHR